MIYHFNTLFTGKSIGVYYNRCCRIVPNDDDWICLWDSDVMVFNTFADWNPFMESVIKNHPDIALFTCMANRIGTHKQRLLPKQDQDGNMVHQRIKAEKIYKQYGAAVRKDVNSISGLMMLFQKKTWCLVGGFYENGILDVDKIFSRAVKSKGWRIGILTGMYVMHYYRMMEGNKDHLLKGV
jgi:GT2 family glycosyltransferase